MYTNFLEQLISEYFEYNGYFTKSNIKIRKRNRGGYDREIDILAYCPKNDYVYHIETSFALVGWEREIEIFKKKFDIKIVEYADILGLNPERIKIFKRAIILEVPKKDRKNKKIEFQSKTDAKLLSIGEFMDIVKYKLQKFKPINKAVPQNLPLLRAIQFVLHSESL